MPYKALAVLLLLLPAVSHAAFYASETDWAGWPEMCRARYVVSGSGRDSVFAARMNIQTVKVWKARMGEAVWKTLHHYCFGLAERTRAQSIYNPTQHAFHLKNAVNEFLFAFNRVPKEHYMYAEIATQLGLTKRDQKDYAGALEQFDRAITTHPEYAGGYYGKSLLYRDRSQYEQARDILVQGNEATHEESAEIQYFLGLTLVALKEYERARTLAAKVYALGYPLPGLRDMLARAGYPLP